jgi:hypothetical protein
MITPKHRRERAMTKTEFIAWQAKSHDALGLRRAYIDIGGDLVTGLVLSQIVYWHLPARSGKSRLRVVRNGQKWLVKKRNDWWDEVRVTAKQVDRALKVLRGKGLITTAIHRFDGNPTTHVAVDWQAFLDAVGQIVEPVLTEAGSQSIPTGKKEVGNKVTSLTKTTTETTSEISNYSNRHSASRQNDKPDDLGRPEDGVRSAVGACESGEVSAELTPEAEKFVGVFLNRRAFRRPQPKEFRKLNLGVAKVFAVGCMAKDIAVPTKAFTYHIVEYLESHPNYLVSSWLSILNEYRLGAFASEYGVDYDLLDLALNPDECFGTYVRNETECNGNCKHRRACMAHKRLLPKRLVEHIRSVSDGEAEKH